jgi:hypothetical protein
VLQLYILTQLHALASTTIACCLHYTSYCVYTAAAGVVRTTQGVRISDGQIVRVTALRGDPHSNAALILHAYSPSSCLEHHGSFALAQVALHVDRSPMLARRLLQEEGPLSRPLWLRVAAALQIVPPAVVSTTAVTAAQKHSSDQQQQQQQQQLIETEGQLYADDFEAEGPIDGTVATDSSATATAEAAIEEATAAVAVACIQLPPPPPERTAAVKLQALVRGRRLYRVFCQQRACTVVIQVSRRCQCVMCCKSITVLHVQC